jgi:NAD(P)H dehydrogenase (quinone)
MHIGIVIHSQSGHTATVAKAIAEKFREAGHEVDIKLLLTTGMPRPGSRRFTICNAPDEEDMAQWEAILVGGPVWGLKASPVIIEFLTWLKKLDGKKALSFVTHGLPWPALGAHQAISAMNEDLNASGGTVMPGEILHYFFGVKKEKLNAAAERIVKNIAG